MSILNAKYFQNEPAAYEKLESVLWPQGPECPHCGVVNDAKPIPANLAKKVRFGLYRCNACKEQFTVKVGTIFESSHIPLHKWLQAAYLINSSKKGISAKQIERTLEVTYKSAWFMMHRLRAAMDPIFVNPGTPMGVHIDRADKPMVKRIVDANVLKATTHYTDGAKWYRNNGMELAGHDWVDHSKEEYVRGNVHTNTIEGVFSIFKKGMKAIYQHCGEQHLHRYLAEFDFRYNNREALGVNDLTRTDNALKGAKGKRMTYQQSASQ